MPQIYSLLNQATKLKLGISWRKILFATTLACTMLIFLNSQHFYNEVSAKKTNAAAEVNHVAKACISNTQNKHYSLRLRPKPYSVPSLEDGDYQKLIDFNGFQFNLVNTRTCATSSIFLLVLITSATQNYKRRQVIRSTWAQNDSKVKVFFMLGAVNNPKVQNSINEENKLYNDIVQGNFVDSYRNLTYKTVMSMKYVVYHCPNATYILKTDDDVFVNMPLMKNYLTNDLSPFGAENYLQCHVMRNIKILRGNWSKWSVTEEQFPGKEYPTYCNGPYILFSPDVLFKLYKEAQKMKYFFIEDVFVYGVAASKYPEIKHTDTRELSLWKYSAKKLSEGTFDNMNFLIGTFGMNNEQLIDFWNYVMSRPVPSSVYDFSYLNSI